MKETCILFETYGELLEEDNGLYINNHIPSKKLKSILDRYVLPNDEETIAFLDTSLLGNFGRSATGILICKSGIDFREDFVSLYFPWHIFRNIPITLISYELEIGKGNRFHIRDCGMPSKEILLFLKKLQQQINNVCDKGTNQLNA